MLAAPLIVLIPLVATIAPWAVIEMLPPLMVASCRPIGADRRDGTVDRGIDRTVRVGDRGVDQQRGAVGGFERAGIGQREWIELQGVLAIGIDHAIIVVDQHQPASTDIAGTGDGVVVVGKLVAAGDGSDDIVGIVRQRDVTAAIKSGKALVDIQIGVIASGVQLDGAGVVDVGGAFQRQRAVVGNRNGAGVVHPSRHVDRTVRGIDRIAGPADGVDLAANRGRDRMLQQARALQIDMRTRTRRRHAGRGVGHGRGDQVQRAAADGFQRAAVAEGAGRVDGQRATIGFDGADVGNACGVVNEVDAADGLDQVGR
jgi:hypothetical protein